MEMNQSVLSPHDVMMYWFGGDWRENYKNKWFASGEVQSSTDEEIYSRFYRTYDAAIHLELDSWLLSDIISLVAYIVLVDQFSRHIHRYLGHDADNETRKLADSLALEAAESLLEKPSWESSLTIAQHVFALMPFRHNASITHLRSVLANIDHREEREIESLDLIARFRKQTLRRLQHLEDRSTAADSTEILERFPFDADESNIMKEPLTIAIESFLKRHAYLHPSSSPSSSSAGISLAISLSGGVDSMVIAKILAVLRAKYHITSILAIHIDYANRDESGREADYVEQWCECTGLTFQKRVVNEVTRGITDRALYERVARDIRYGFYQQVLRESGCAAVMFGHHLGDVQENVISNIMRGCSPLQLSGMTEVGLTNGVRVWRPLLSHPKSDIFTFAHKYGVPYFKDTTPSWSTRGKLRRQLVPLLTDMYGEGFLHNLSTLACESDDYQALVQSHVFQPFLSGVTFAPCGLRVNILPYRMQPLSFWKEMLKQLMHAMSMALIRDKAVKSFLERIQYDQPFVGWLELRKGYHTYLTADGTLVIYRTGVLSEAVNAARGNHPSHDHDHPESFSSHLTSWEAGFTVDVTSMIHDSISGIEVRLGVWDISIAVARVILSDTSSSHPTFSKVISSEHPQAMDTPLTAISDLLPGTFIYHVFVPVRDDHDARLMVWSEHPQYHTLSARGKHTSSTSPASTCMLWPPAMMRIDARLKLGIPLLVPTMTAMEDGVVGARRYAIVKLTYRFQPVEAAHHG